MKFRSASRAVDKVFDGLAQRSVTFVAVDEPDLPGWFPPLDVVTNPEFFYVRIHRFFRYHVLNLKPLALLNAII